MNTNDAVYAMAVKVLDHRRETVQYNALRVMDVYKDDFIVIEGLHPINLNENRKYDTVYIAILTPSNVTTDVTIFGVSKRTRTDETMVYVWQLDRMFYRPGQWSTYLERLATELETEVAEIMKLNDVPVDDTEFFKDMP